MTRKKPKARKPRKAKPTALRVGAQVIAEQRCPHCGQVTFSATAT